MQEIKKVCDGCWKRGVCKREIDCTCPCTTEGWLHTDDPRNKNV